MENEKIGNYLKQRRKEVGISQATLAKEMGVTFQAVSRWEKGDSIPDIETLCNLADYYNVSVDDILQRTQVESSKEEFEFTIPSFFIIIINYFIGMMIFFVLKDFGGFWEPVGYIVIIVFLIAGVFLQNMNYFMLSNKSKKDKLWYFISYIPFTIAFLFFFLIDGGLID